jgi:hypothetical protein
VLTAGSRTGQVLILKKGAVAIVKEDIGVAKVAEPGTVFGEFSALLDRPHSADVRASFPCRNSCLSDTMLPAVVRYLTCFTYVCEVGRPKQRPELTGGGTNVRP